MTDLTGLVWNHDYAPLDYQAVTNRRTRIGLLPILALCVLAAGALYFSTGMADTCSQDGVAVCGP